jgi:hypothetical protein
MIVLVSGLRGSKRMKAAESRGEANGRGRIGRITDAA